MLDDDLRHFPSDISQEIEEYATENIFNLRRYVFTHRHGRKQYGYCTHCQTDHQLPGVRHNENTICPGCKSLVTAKGDGMGRKSLIDEAYFVYYEKSQADPSSIIARGFYAVRDYSRGYHNVQTNIIVNAMYLFQPGSSAMWLRSVWYSHHSHEYFLGSFYQRKSVFSIFSQTPSSVFAHAVSLESITAAVYGTPFQYSCWNEYSRFGRDMVELFSLYSAYPSIEYLTKMGFKNLVESKLQKENTFHAINWRGKTPMAVLRLNKQKLRSVHESGKTLEPIELRLMQIAKRRKENVPIEMITKISSVAYSNWDDFNAMLQRIPLRRLCQYVIKQYDKQPKQKRALFSTHYQVFTHWRDYIADCIALEMDLGDESVLYPGNLHRAHQGTIAKRKAIADEKTARKIAARVQSLQKYRFACGGLMIIPATSAAELIAEGKALSHCVGTYAQKHADGITTILFVRREADPDKPFYTMEISEKDRWVIQCRGLKNVSQTPEVEAFVDEFVKQKLAKKSKIA